MKRYSSPIMEILTMGEADIVMLSGDYVEKNTTYFTDTWGNRFSNDNN